MNILFLYNLYFDTAVIAKYRIIQKLIATISAKHLFSSSYVCCIVVLIIII